MYIRNTCRVNDRIEIEKHYNWNAGAPGINREDKKNKTPDAVAKQNLINRKKELRRLMELNFRGGDIHVTLTCRPDERPDMEEAMKVIRAFRNRMRDRYKKNHWIFKYIITTETGSRGAVHWHMIVNNMQNDTTSTQKLIWELWDRGRPYFVPMDKNREYGQLADYIIKETSKRIAEGKTMEKLSYMCSRNLIRPVVRKKKIDRRTWKKEPKAPKGWELIKESVINGVNQYTGLPYQHYNIRKIQDKGGGAGGAAKHKCLHRYLNQGD